MNMVDLDSVIDGTDITIGEVLGLGQQTLGAATAMVTLGHAGIGGLTDYAKFPTDRMSQVLEGIVRSALQIPAAKRASRDALERILWDSGWMQRAIEIVAAKAAGPLDTGGASCKARSHDTA